MARPKKGTPEGDRATKKWRETMIKKYGVDAFGGILKMQEIGRIGGQNGTTGGFASEKVGTDGLTGRERAKVAGKKGGFVSKRGPSKD